MNQVIEQMKNRRSVRGFSGESVKDEDLKEILVAAQQAPSSVNGEQVLSENVNTMTTDKSVSIQGIGTVTIKVYLDGNLKRTENINQRG